MIKPKRHYVKTKLPCQYVTLKFLIDRKHILAVLIDELRYGSKDKKLTRSQVEKEIRRNLMRDGESWFENEEQNPDYVFPEDGGGRVSSDLGYEEFKALIFQTASKLFPDWFAPSSVNYILALEKEK